jgi:crooked neck
MSLGKCPRIKVFKHYAELEYQLGEADRCRTIYEKFIGTFAQNSSAWVEYAEFEASLEEPERARAIFEIAVNSEHMD